MPDKPFNLGDLADPISLGLGAVETGLSLIDKIGAKKRQRNLLNQRKAYQTPEEIYDILNATEANASQGYDATTLNYLTNQTDQTFSSGADAILKAGGNPNDLSSLFGQKINAIMKIGSNNHELNMANFAQYLSALDSVASNKAAEQKSQQDIIKDKLQAEGLNIQNDTTNISNGLNTIVGTLSAEAIQNLYNPDGTLKKKRTNANGNTLAIDNTYQGTGLNYNTFG